ncbi:DUF6273 domain-containing protein [Ruminococcus flavefaciens]|uniref:DUF6273 domain-containing protein n=1 Tax=Ruminococcus flavefaciens TaxID=1265 RepID=UPI000491F09D|nr:DUF6273 domain-containing protein [Ruminococcus flavefaciens]
MKKRRAMTAFGCALCIAAAGAFTGCSNNKNGSEPVEAVTADTKTVAPDVQVGTYITFGSYEQDNDLTNGKEDIEWLVLAREDNKALLISRYSLDNQPYSEHTAEVPWENCFLRKWLNNNFLNEAFSSEEQNSIITSVVTADENPFHKLSQGNDTMDKVFILSVIEANKYFSSNSERLCQGTAYCHAHGAPKSKDTGNCWWWLRTLNSAFVAAVVDDEGPIEAGAADNDKNNSSSGGDYVTCMEASVRPSVWIDLGLADPYKDKQEYYLLHPEKYRRRSDRV